MPLFSEPVNLLDMRTVIVSSAVSNFICMAVLAFLRSQGRRRLAGPGYWMAGFALQCVSLVLIGLRGVAPDLLSIVVGNAAAIGGAILILVGLERFAGKRGTQLHNIVLLAAFTAGMTYFALVRANMTVRNILFSATMLAVCLQCAWLTMRRVSGDTRGITRGVGWVFLAFALVSLLRVVADLAVHPGNDFFRSGLYDTLALVVYQMLAIVLTFSLFLMVNRRLAAQMEGDTAARAQAESALRLSEEKFAKAFRSSPDAIAISRLSDGRILDANDGFLRLSGYTREEVLASSSLGLGLWNEPAQREQILATLRSAGRVVDTEVALRTRSGKILTCQYSGENIALAEEPCALSVIRDVSERRRAEDIMRLRLALWEYSFAHSLQELMQKALDEIEVPTGSLIGFYHFVEEAEQSVTLKAWSTRTRAEFCKAEGQGMHYALADAGVWVDCVRARRPVIHNDYASLPHRKGMPPGHAHLVRELVVPTMREGKVVSILGVGNKATDYTQQDIELVTYIADLVWTIVTQKRADERILLLNQRLERQAMTDELTGLANRRAFFVRGNEEIKRSRRYGTPLCLLMLDVDKFKDINDGLGHEAGDGVLKSVARILQSGVREIDLAARLGGEEFAVILANTAITAAAVLAERLRRAVETEARPKENPGRVVTVSVGVASGCADTPDIDSLLRGADEAMYRAKSAGRNRVVVLDGAP